MKAEIVLACWKQEQAGTFALRSEDYTAATLKCPVQCAFFSFSSYKFGLSRTR